MSAVHVTVVWPDDEHVDVEVNGEVVASANHDEHGWSGMEAVVKTATAVAEAAGLDIHTEGSRHRQVPQVRSRVRSADPYGCPGRG